MMFNRISSGPILILLMIPYFMIILFGLMDQNIITRDLDAYVGEIQTSELELGLDFLSWSILKIIFTEIHLSQNSLRLFAFILYTLTCFFIYLKAPDKRILYLFVLSSGFLLPVLLLSQIRLLIAICLFSILILYTRSKVFSVFIGGLSHFSVFLLIFFPSVFFIGFLSEVLEQISFNITGLSRIQSYFEIARAFQVERAPIYFGWELFLLALIYGFSREFKTTFLILMSLTGILYIHYSFGLSTDAARRLIELGLFAFSPFLINAVPALIKKETLRNDFPFINLFFWSILLLQNYKLSELVNII